MRRPREVHRGKTPDSPAGEPSQKSSTPPPAIYGTHKVLKSKEGTHEHRPYKLSGRKHSTEAY